MVNSDGSIVASHLIAAGKVTASSSDNTIQSPDGFNHINLKNMDSTNSITVTIDEVSTGTPAKPIYINAGDTFSDSIQGQVLHYSAPTGSPILKYAIR